MKKIICFIVSVCFIINTNLFVVHAETAVDTELENNTEITAEAEETVEDILDDFENNSDELQQKVDNVIEKNSDNFIVKFFKSIIDTIAEFLDAIFELALKATKIR